MATAMTPQRRLYEFRLANGLCPRCGKPKDRKGFYCTECKDITNTDKRLNKEFRRSIRICPDCGKERLFENEKRCPECKAKNAAYKAKQYWANPEKKRKQQSEYHRKQYAERIEKGLCTRCGKRKPYPGARRCEICRERDRERQRIRYKNKIPDRYEEGICYRCGNPIENRKYKLCNKCVEQNRINSVFTNRQKGMTL